MESERANVPVNKEEKFQQISDCDFSRKLLFESVHF